MLFSGPPRSAVAGGSPTKRERRSFSKSLRQCEVALTPAKVAMKIRPLYDRILATRVPEEEKTSGGLFIPDTAKEKPLQALVVAVGNGKVLESGNTQPLTVKAGDKVLIGKYSGSEVKLEGQDHIILREEEVLAILD
jgi:chaperonin GroES